jgi:hypothetical protein
MEVGYDETLALMTAHPDTWELRDVPPWLASSCEAKGLAIRVPSGAWKLTDRGYRYVQQRKGEGAGQGGTA